MKMKTITHYFYISGVGILLAACSSRVEQLTVISPHYQKLESLYVQLTKAEEAGDSTSYERLKKEYYAGLQPFWGRKNQMPVKGAEFTDMLARKHGINLFYMKEGRLIPAYLIFMETIHDPAVNKTKTAQEIYDERYTSSRKG